MLCSRNMIFSLHVQQCTLLLCHWFSLKGFFSCQCYIKMTVTWSHLYIMFTCLCKNVQKYNTFVQSCSPVRGAVGTGLRSEPDLQDSGRNVSLTAVSEYSLTLSVNVSSAAADAGLQSAECECAEHVCTWSSAFIHSFTASLSLSIWMSLGHSQLSCNALTLICSQIRFTAALSV